MSFYYVYGDESSSDSDYGRHHHHGSHHAQYGHHGHSRSDLRSSHHEHRSGSRRHQRQAERSPSPPLRAPRPPPATKAKRCKRHRARSPSPTERAVSPPLAARGRRSGTREEYREPTGYASVAASLANLNLGNGDSDSDEPGVQSRHGRRRSPTTRKSMTCTLDSMLRADAFHSLVRPSGHTTRELEVRRQTLDQDRSSMMSHCQEGATSTLMGVTRRCTMVGSEQ